MSDTVTDRLNTALAERDRLDRKLGARGMAMVHLACGVRHDRRELHPPP